MTVIEQLCGSLLTSERKLWRDPAGARLVDIALFCDGDEMDGRTVGYFADVSR